MKYLVGKILDFLLLLIFFPFLFGGAIFTRLKKKKRARLLFGCDPILNFSYYSRAMQAIGYESKSLVNNFYSINKREDWDYVLSDYLLYFPVFIKPAVYLVIKYMAFMYCLMKFEIYFTTFNGLLLGHKITSFFFRIAGKKIVILPFGSDGYIYRRIRSLRILHSLMIDYSGASREQERIKRQVDYWCKNADAIIPGVMGLDGYGRWDILTPSHLFIDLIRHTTSSRMSKCDGKNGIVVIAHSPNHRGVKGTEWIIKAVDELLAEGYKVELRLIEKKPNSTVLKILREDADILVEQLNGYGYALSGIEGMAAGIPVISSPQCNEYMEPFRIWSFFDECPIVGSSYKDIKADLLRLIVDPGLRLKLGKAGREYVEKYHGLDSAQYMITNVIDYVHGRKNSLINLYHPLLGEYTNRSPKINHPLVNNRVVD